MKKLDAVESAEYNIATSQLKIAGKGPRVNRQTIVQVIEKLGHKVEAKDKTKSAVLHIEGMDCEDEVSVIEKKMKSLKGLDSFQLDLRPSSGILSPGFQWETLRMKKSEEDFKS